MGDDILVEIRGPAAVHKAADTEHLYENRGDSKKIYSVGYLTWERDIDSLVERIQEETPLPFILISEGSGEYSAEKWYHDGLETVSCVCSNNGELLFSEFPTINGVKARARFHRVMLRTLYALRSNSPRLEEDYEDHDDMVLMHKDIDDDLHRPGGYRDVIRNAGSLSWYEECREDARFAIEAIREITPEMQELLSRLSSGSADVFTLKMHLIPYNFSKLSRGMRSDAANIRSDIYVRIAEAYYYGVSHPEEHVRQYALESLRVFTNIHYSLRCEQLALYP